MNLGNLGYRRMLFIYGAMIVAVATALTVGVIDPVKAEAALGATPERAVTAFWVNIAVSLFSALALVFTAIRSKNRGWISTSTHLVVGCVVLFLGIALADAAAAYRSHGPSMQQASTLLFICAVADVLTGVSIVATAFLRPKKG